jgi:hypothetical protein
LKESRMKESKIQNRKLVPVGEEEGKRLNATSIEQRIKEELEKVRKMKGVIVKGRLITVPAQMSGANPIQFLARNGFVVTWS